MGEVLLYHFCRLVGSFGFLFKKTQKQKNKTALQKHIFMAIG